MNTTDAVDALLVMADKDYRALGGMLLSTAFDDEIVGFHAQQTAEKLLKAWLEILGLAYGRTHDIGVLIGLLEDGGADVSSVWALDDLTSFAVVFRYTPCWPDSPTLDKTGIFGALTSLRQTVLEARASMG